MVQKCGSEPCGKDFAEGHHPRLQARPRLAEERRREGEARELLEVRPQDLLRGDPERLPQLEVARPDARERLLVTVLDRQGEQLFETVGNAGEGRADDQRAVASASRRAAREAMVAQRSGVETLVPPNLRTTQPPLTPYPYPFAARIASVSAGSTS